MSALLGALMPHIIKSVGPFSVEVDIQAINQDLARLPDKPDETLL